MRIGFLVLITILVSRMSFAQSELTMPFLENVYQSTYSNAAAIPEHKISIGLPGISSIYGGATNTGFSFNDMVGRRANDSTYLDFDKLIGKTRKKNYVYSGAAVDLFSFRIKVRDYFFSINISEKASARFSYPKDLLILAWNGNAKFIGSKADLQSLGVDGMHYREFGFNMAKETRHWIFGGRVKYLTGLSNVNLKTKNLGLSVDSDMYELGFTSDATLNTSGIPLDSNDNFNTDDPNYVRNYLTNFKNPGFALDGGVSYKYNTKWTFSFSFNNLGFIRWKDGVKNYRVKGGAAFAGFDLGEAYFSDSLDAFDAYADSLGNSFEYSETEDKYTTWLVPNFYLSAKYNLGKKTEAVASIYFEKYKAIRPAFTIGITQKVGKVLNIVVNYSAQYNKFNNVGLGIMVKPGPFQIYAVTDNVLAPFYPYSAKYLNVRCGMNLVFGRIKEADKQPFNYKNK